MSIKYPIKGQNAIQLYTLNENGKAGFYPVGAYRFWHGGINLTFDGGGGDQPIRAIADGKIVAYRITDDYCTFEKKFDEQEKEVAYIDENKKCSNNFVLIKHTLKPFDNYPIEFYSLYMHLLPYGQYNPDYDMGKISIFNRWKTTVKTSEDGKGITLKNEKNEVKGFIPKDGVVFRVPGKDGEFKGENPIYKYVTGLFGSGFVWFEENKTFKLLADGSYQCIYKKDEYKSVKAGLNVRRNPLFGKEVVAVKPKDAVLNFKEPHKAITSEGKIVTGYKELKDSYSYYTRVHVDKLISHETSGYVYIGEEQVHAERNPIVSSKLEVQKVDMEVSAGDVLGWPGYDGRTTDPSVHLEIFLKRDALSRFYANPNHCGQEDSVLKIPKGTVFSQRDLDKLPNAEIPKDAILELKKKEGGYRQITGASVVTGWVKYGLVGQGSRGGVLEFITGTETETPVYAEYYTKREIEYAWRSATETQESQKNLYMAIPYDATNKVKVYLMEKRTVGNVKYRKIRYPIPSDKAVTITGWVAKSKLLTKMVYDGDKCRYRAKETITEIYPSNPEKINFKTTNPPVKSEKDLLVLKRDCAVVKDDANKVWIGIPQKAIDQESWLDGEKYKGDDPKVWIGIDSLGKMNLYNWSNFFEQLSESDAKFSQDGFCDNVQRIADLIPDSDDDGDIDGNDIKSVMDNKKEAKKSLRQFVVDHPSEWYYSDSSKETKWGRLKSDPTIFGRVMEAEKEYPAFLETVENVSFLQQVDGFTETEKLWYFHPIAFVQHLKRIFGKIYRGNFKDFCDMLGDRESGNDYTSVNYAGYLGKYQFGMSALTTLGYAERISPGWQNENFQWKTGYSKEQFLTDGTFQERVFKEWVTWHQNYIKNNYSNYLEKTISVSEYESKYLKKNPNIASKYGGSKISKIQISESGLVGGLHIGGSKKVGKFLSSNGAIDKKDGLGTPVSEYIYLFGGFDLDF